MGLEYLKIQGDVLVAHGPDAAVLLALLTFRTNGAAGWTATYADIEEDTGLTPRRIRGAADTLRDADLLETTTTGIGRTLRWWPKRRNVTTQTPKRHLDTVYRETNITKSADAGIGAPVMADVTPIDGGLFPSDAVDRREPTADDWANECRKIWQMRFREATGHDPHPDTSSKAFGHIKRACSRSVTQDHFRDVWRAARDAGTEGRWQVQVDPVTQPRYASRGNQYVEIVKADHAASMRLLGIDDDVPRELNA